MRPICSNSPKRICERVCGFFFLFGVQRRVLGLQLYSTTNFQTSGQYNWILGTLKSAETQTKKQLATCSANILMPKLWNLGVNHDSVTDGRHERLRPWRGPTPTEVLSIWFMCTLSHTHLHTQVNHRVNCIVALIQGWLFPCKLTHEDWKVVGKKRQR